MRLFQVFLLYCLIALCLFSAAAHAISWSGAIICSLGLFVASIAYLVLHQKEYR